MLSSKKVTEEYFEEKNWKVLQQVSMKMEMYSNISPAYAYWYLPEGLVILWGDIWHVISFSRWK